MERAGEHNRITVERGLHVSEDQLESYALGRLPDSDVSLLEEHLILCAACRENLDRIGDAALGLREALNAYPAPELAAARSRDWFSWVRRPVFPMAIAFAAILGVIAVLSINKPALAPVASIQLMATRGEMATAAPAREFEQTRHLVRPPQFEECIRAARGGSAGSPAVAGWARLGCGSDPAWEGGTPSSEGWRCRS